MRPTARCLAIALAIAVGLLAHPLAAEAGERALTNEDILALTRAGIHEAVIVAKIAASQTAFDTSVVRLLTLAEAGVHRSVLEAMAKSDVEPSPQAAERDGFAGTPCAGRAVRTVSVLVDNGDGFLRIEPNVAGVRTGNLLSGPLSAVTYGLLRPKSKAVVRGAKSDLRVGQSTPTFWFCFGPPSAGIPHELNRAANPDDLVLVAFRVREKRGERTFGLGNARTGMPEKQRRDVRLTRVAAGVYRVMPTAPLAGGEYGFYYAALRIPWGWGAGMAVRAEVFAFGID